MIIETFKHSLIITSFVFIMMLLIEYINVQTEGVWQKEIKESRWKQYFLGALLGALPGCLGAFTVISLYSHRVISLGAVVTTMIATSGDEAFVMFSLIPLEALRITAILVVTGLVAGFLTDKFGKNTYYIRDYHELPLHEEESCQCFPKGKILYQLKHIIFTRALLIIFLLLFLILLVSGSIGPEFWDWKRITFSIGTVFSLFVVSTVPDHFLEEHLWEHVFKKHLLSIFIWTFGTLLFLDLLKNFIDIEHWIQNNLLVILIIAVLVGIIPESGPHLLFVNLYIAGTIPLSILIASSIVQDGHGMLPMLAVSKRSFLWVKLINVFVGLLVGAIGLKLF